jgi:flagella basal body P-ring formation protein FlgA
MIKLGDIATIRGLDRTRRARLKRVELGLTPVVGLSKYVQRSYIERRIKASIGAGIRITGPNRVEIRRRSTVLRGSWLMQRLRGAIEVRLPYDAKRVAEISIPKLPDVRVPDGASARVTFKRGERFQGDITIEVVIEDDGAAISTRQVSAKIDLFETALTVGQDLRRGHLIQSTDIISTRIAASKMPPDAVTRPELIVGAQLQRRIRPGDTLRQAWLKVPPVIKRGDRVRVVARRGPIRLTTVGQAMNSAARSSFVRVRNMSSKKIVTGRAMGPGLVEMEF